MQEKTLVKPQVHHSSSGVVHVKAAEILMSQIGREEISKAAGYALKMNIRKSMGVTPIPVKGK